MKSTGFSPSTIPVCEKRNSLLQGLLWAPVRLPQVLLISARPPAPLPLWHRCRRLFG